MRHHLQFASERRIILQAHGKTRKVIITCMVRHSQFYLGGGGSKIDVHVSTKKHCNSGNYVFLLKEIMALATCCTHSNIEQLVQAVP